MKPPPDGNDTLNAQQGEASSVTIQIDKTDLQYTGSTSETVKVFSKNNEPKFGYTRFTHKVQGTADDKYKRITSGATYTNGGQSITLTGAPSNVHYVNVYYYRINNKDVPLLICVAKDNTGTGTTPDAWKYFKNGDPTSPNSTSWSSEPGLTKNPDGSDNNKFLMHLDMLNDRANSQIVIHIEKTNESGTIDGGNSNKIYKTGASGDTKTITVAKTVGSASNGVPQGYTEYKHTPDSALSNPKFKFNGSTIQGFPNDIDIRDNKPFKVYYKGTDTSRPLFAYFQTTNNKHKLYARGLVWWRLIRENNGALSKDDLGPIFANEMPRINRQGTFRELKIFYDHSSSI